MNNEDTFWNTPPIPKNISDKAIQEELHKKKLYTPYTNSKHWINRRNQYYTTHERICKECSSDRNVTLHHLTYENVWNERDEDLIPLCWSCHMKKHRFRKKV